LPKQKEIREIIKEIQIGKKVISRWHDPIVKRPQSLNQKFSRTDRHFWKFNRIQNQPLKIGGFVHTYNEQGEKDIRKTFTIDSKTT
jgi:hypothetical protein